jgi:general secretion pathway protein D
MSVQEAQDIASGVQQTMEMRRIAVDAGRRTIFLRDQESKIVAARKIISDLARFRAQVQIDVELVSVAKTSALSYGLSLPTSIPIVNFSSVLGNIPATIAGVTSFATFGGGATLLGMGIADASAFATVSRSESESILTSRAVTLDGQQVTVHIGDRYPIATSIYTDTSSAANTIPSLSYVDLGLKLQMTPVVHEGEMSLTIEAEYSVLGTSTANSNPVISTRKLQGTSRVAFGEYAVIAGLASVNVGNQTSGIPFLSRIPGIGRMFRHTVKSKDSSEVLIVLKPHLISDPPWERPPSEMWTGTETVPAAVY